MSCQDCKRLLDPKHGLNTGSAINRAREARHWRSISELKESSTQCKICATLFKRLPADASSTTNMTPLSALTRAALRIGEIASGAVVYDTKLFNNKHDDSGQTARLDVRLVSVGSRIVNKSLMPAGSSQDTISSFLIVPEALALPLRQGTSCVQDGNYDSALKQAERWLNACLNTHGTCSKSDQQQQNIDHGFVPTRLIQILDDRIRLCSNTTQRRFKYATLSHRWPTDASTLMQLTTENMQTFKNGIDEDDPSFSRVFHDALTVCRYLKITHLWIDSICIIQSGDNGQDWLQEAARMGEVYKNAILNIAATAVRDGEEGARSGFLRSSNHNYIAPFKITHTKNCITGAREDTPYLLVPLDDFTDEIDQAVLNRRAWVMQERHLSSRILHFGPEQIWWECDDLVCSEAYAQGHPAFIFRKPPRSENFLSRLTSFPSSSRAFLAASNVWDLLVEVYSRGSLTYGEDKLVAFSGIARELRSYFNIPEDDYLAGCWRQHFPHCLLWSVKLEEDAQHPTRSSNGCQAPTWSWASVSRPISRPHRGRGKFDILATVSEINVSPLNDPFGEVQPDGNLKIRGTLYKAQLAYTHLYNNTYAEIRKGFFVGTAYYSIFRTSYSGKSRASFATMSDEPYIEGQTPSERDVYLLPVLKSQYRNVWYKNESDEWVVMLMLEKCLAAEEGTFRRCGVVELKGQGSHKALEVSWAEARSKDAPRETCITLV